MLVLKLFFWSFIIYVSEFLYLFYDETYYREIILVSFFFVDMTTLVTTDSEQVTVAPRQLPLAEKPLKNAACLYQLFILSPFYCKSREQLNGPSDSLVSTPGLQYFNNLYTYRNLSTKCYSAWVIEILFCRWKFVDINWLVLRFLVVST